MSCVDGDFDMVCCVVQRYEKFDENPVVLLLLVHINYLTAHMYACTHTVEMVYVRVRFTDWLCLIEAD